ncbi:hypothetical protein POTOM_044348 [Populus tomentosa]|uniref:Uncharacterized protein n=1 Tax=Populus tomentosa TaxID=118781 RepID=A0A8X7YJA1_POPTO|nr:hypothetical protein POTOM_044348 [Populus tomentosa]
MLKRHYNKRVKVRVTCEDYFRRQIGNVVACEGVDQVKRIESFAQWKNDRTYHAAFAIRLTSTHPCKDDYNSLRVQNGANPSLSLESSLEFRIAFNHVEQFDCDFKANPSAEEWNKATATCECLKEFYKSTCNFPTSREDYFLNVCDVYKNLLKWEQSDYVYVSAMANRMKGKFRIAFNHWNSFMKELKEQYVGLQSVLITSIAPKLSKHSDYLGRNREWARHFGGTNLESRQLLCNRPDDIVNCISKLRRKRKDMIVVVNWNFTLHKLLAQDGAMEQVLSKVKDLKADIMVIVEQEANLNSLDLTEWLEQSFQYYSTIFESLEGEYNTKAFWEMYFRRQIGNAVACERVARLERIKSFDQWQNRLSRAGFCPVPQQVDKLKIDLPFLLKEFGIEEKEGHILLCRHRFSLAVASVWKFTDPPQFNGDTVDDSEGMASSSESEDDEENNPCTMADRNLSSTQDVQEQSAIIGENASLSVDGGLQSTNKRRNISAVWEENGKVCKYCKKTYLQPLCELHSKDEVTDDVLTISRREKEKLINCFDKLSCLFSLSIDLGSSNDKMMTYCCFTVHFIDDGWQLKKKILAFRNLRYNYDMGTVHEVLKSVLTEWSINKNVRFIFLDITPPNDHMIGELKSKVSDQAPPIHRHLFCVPSYAQTLILLAQDGFSEIRSVLYKIRECIEYVKGSSLIRQRFQEAINNGSLQDREMPTLDVPARWDTTFLMLESSLEFITAFNHLEQLDDDFKVNPPAEEWNKATAVCECLKEFYKSICNFGVFPIGNYLKFYDAKRSAYPDIKIISNCDGLWITQLIAMIIM